MPAEARPPGAAIPLRHTAPKMGVAMGKNIPTEINAETRSRIQM